MLESIVNPLQVSWTIWFVTLGCAFINGLSKSGIKGIGMVSIPILAFLYGGMTSAGILLPFLIFGDLFAIRNYRASIKWSQIKSLLPWAMGGILLAVAVGKFISDGVFRNMMAIAVIICLAVILYFDFSGKKTDLSKFPVLSKLTGFSGGFATMIGNAAGPIFDVYLLSMRLQKASFLGTGAIFFLILNLFKLPFHFFVWHSVTLSSLQMNLIMMPSVFLGSWAGKRIVSYIPEREFRYLVIIIIALSAALLLIR
jgi:uncharacterized membrane protein YfcA